MKNDITGAFIGTLILVRSSFPIDDGLSCSGHHFECCRPQYFYTGMFQKKLMDYVGDAERNLVDLWR